MIKEPLNRIRRISIFVPIDGFARPKTPPHTWKIPHRGNGAKAALDSIPVQGPDSARVISKLHTSAKLYAGFQKYRRGVGGIYFLVNRCGADHELDDTHSCGVAGARAFLFVLYEPLCAGGG